MSEGLWHLTRTLPENHAIMVCLGEGLMPKAGETPEMGANPLLGFGRVYARPEVARTVDRRVRRLLNEPGHTLRAVPRLADDRGITIWGAAVDTLENTSRFAEGKETGPDGGLPPLRLAAAPSPGPTSPTWAASRVPAGRAASRRGAAILLDYRTPRAKVVEAIQATYPGIRASTSTSGRCAARAA